MAVDTAQLALQNKALLQSMGYTVDAAGNVTQQQPLPGPHGVSPGNKTVAVSPNEWLYKIPGVYAPGKAGSDPVSGLTPYGTSVIQGLPSEQTGFGNTFKQTQWNPDTGQYDTSVNWPEVLTLAAVGGTGAGATLGGLYGGAAAPGAAGNSGDAAALAETAAEGGGAGAGTGATAGATAATKAGASVGNTLTSPNIWSSIINGLTSLWGAKNSSDASTAAAQIQADAATKAAQLAYQAGQNSLAFQQQQWNTSQANLAPWLRTGQSAINTLGGLMGLSPTGSGPTAQLPGGAAPTTMSSLYGSQAPAQGGQPGPAAPAQSGQPFSKIVWPDGHSDTVPQQSLNQYQLLGAKVVG